MELVKQTTRHQKTPEIYVIQFTKTFKTGNSENKQTVKCADTIPKALTAMAVQ